MIRKLFNLALVVALSVTATIAQQPGSNTASSDRLRQIITYLASDALEGRRTGTPGANDAARYIAGEFKRYGLSSSKPAIRAGRERGESVERYLQPFPYVATAELGGTNGMFYEPPETVAEAMAKPTALPVPYTAVPPGSDWMPLGFSANTGMKETWRVPVTFVGYGLRINELRYDDYAGKDLNGHIALAFEGTPDADNPHGEFSSYGDVKWKVTAAQERGAKALVIIASEDKFNDDRLSRLTVEHTFAQAQLPVFVVSRQLASKWFAREELPSLPELQARIASAWASSRKAQGEIKNASQPLEKLRLTMAIQVIRRESPSFNVIGILPGSDPKLKEEAIVIGAHYDHLGRGGEGSLAPREGEIHHGADDNASGVAGLIELARMLSTQNPKPRRTIVFIAFSGEEEGLIGSSYYVNHPIVPLSNTVAMINMDMIGRLKDNKLILGGIGTASDWRSIVYSENAHTSISATGGPGGIEGIVAISDVPRPSSSTVSSDGRKLSQPSSSKPDFDLTLNEDGFGPSDHSSFYAKQVPVLFFWTGTHDDYHKPSDTADKINYEGEARIVSFVSNVVRDIDRSERRPTYTVAKSESQGRSTGFRVFLGTIPNYADSNDGLKLDGVRDDSPASKAGLKAGDRIVKMAGHEVKNVYDYTYALGEMKAGQEYEVEIVRGSEHLTLKITPAVRK